MTSRTQAVVIGGGQAGLAAAGGPGVSPGKHSHLRRLGLDFVILDARTEVGGAWLHAWVTQAFPVQAAAGAMVSSFPIAASTDGSTR